MGIPQTIDERCRALALHRAALLEEWRRHPTTSKIAGGIAALATGVVGGLILRRVGFGKVRKLYTYAMLIGRVKSQIQARHLQARMPERFRHGAGRRANTHKQPGAKN